VPPCREDGVSLLRVGIRPRRRKFLQIAGYFSPVTAVRVGAGPPQKDYPAKAGGHGRRLSRDLALRGPL
jgi:hypothetical protein